MPISTASKLLKRRRTRIVATLGPASAAPAVIEELVRAGVNVFRLNMSHGDHEGHRRLYESVRDVERRLGAVIAVLADLCGPKIRTGAFVGGSITLEPGRSVTVTTRDELGTIDRIPSQYAALVGDVRVGDRILLDDGNLELAVEAIATEELRCGVIRGGVLRDHKGMNLPGVAVSAPSLTDKDRTDAAFAIELGVDLLALSFVRRASDVVDLRRLVAGAPDPPGIIAKIEKPEALDDIEAILDASDGIMVARGDLGVELPPEKVPVAQDQLVERGRARFKPVIVATQMLESMVKSGRPTRAEVSDVSTAVRAGADAVMLSAETASGDHPVEAVRVMDRVARETESYLWSHGAFGDLARERRAEQPLELGAAVARAAAQLSRDLMVRAIVVISRGGVTARMISSARPAAPVLAASASAATCRRMGLLWGVVPFPMDAGADPRATTRQVVLEADLGGPGDRVLTIRGFSDVPEESTPSITVMTL